MKTFFRIWVVHSKKRPSWRRFAMPSCMAVDDMEIITRLDAADDIDGNEGSGDSSSEEDEGLDDE